MDIYMAWVVTFLCIIMFVVYILHVLIDSRDLQDQLDIVHRKLDSEREQYRLRIIELEETTRLKISEAEKNARKDALTKSRAILRGQATEHLAPIMTKQWSHKDFRFIGNPIDYVIFSGTSAITDGEDCEIGELVLLDIKTGTSDLTKVQRKVRDAIISGRVKFAVFNPDKEDLRIWGPNKVKETTNED
jgi:predicted Holliday junction resolvase-like endonuclease